MRTITTEFTAITEDEWRLLFWHGYRKRKLKVLVVSCLGLILLAVGAAGFNSILIGAGGGMAILGPIDILYVSWWLKRHIRNPENRALLIPARAIITEEEIALEYEDGRYSRFPWSALVKVEPYREDWILFLSELMIVVILRRAQSPEDWAQFEEWIKNWRPRG